MTSDVAMLTPTAIPMVAEINNTRIRLLILPFLVRDLANEIHRLMWYATTVNWFKLKIEVIGYGVCP